MKASARQRGPLPSPSPKPNGTNGAVDNQKYSQAAQVALQFLQRVQLQGQEVDAFATVRGMLAAIAQGQLVVSAKNETGP